MSKKITNPNAVNPKLIEFEELNKFMAMSVQQSSEGMAYADLDGNLIFINKAWCEMHGYNSDKELLGKNLNIFHSKKQMENEVIPFNDIVMKSGTNGGEVGHITKGGKPFPTLMTVNLLKDAKGKAFAIAGIAKDITLQKEIEDQLKESDKKRRVWLENSPVCTKIVDLDFNLQYMSSSGIKDLKIDDITKHYGKPYPFHFYPDSFKIPMSKNLKEVKETGKIITQEASVLSIEGKELWYQSTLVPVYTHNGKLDYIMVVSLHTTERKQAEQKLMDRNKELEIFYEATVNRELKLVELKKEINELLKKSGEKTKYEIPV